VPPGHFLQTPPIAGQSSVVLHSGSGFGGHAKTHEPSMQSNVAQVSLPQGTHLGGGAPQSIALLHMPEVAHWGKPGWHLPSALQ
jgi:hypothetical protein